MNLSRLWRMTKKDIVLTTREKFFLFMIVVPVIATFMINAALGSSETPNPTLAYSGNDALSEILEGYNIFDMAYFDDMDKMLEAVERGDYDAGIVAVEGPVLYVSGQSLLSERTVILSTVSKAISELEGHEDALKIEGVMLGEEAYSIKVRIIPFLLIFSVMIAGFIISSSLVEERERKTINALLVSPASPLEVILSKSIYGIFLGLVLSAVILVENGALTELLILPFLLLGTLLAVGLGLLGGSVMENITDLITRMKIFGLFLQFPAIVILFPQIPSWIAKLFPTYYFIDPVLRISQEGAGIGDVWIHAIVLGVIDVLVLLAAAKVLRDRIIGRNIFV